MIRHLLWLRCSTDLRFGECKLKIFWGMQVKSWEPDTEWDAGLYFCY